MSVHGPSLTNWPSIPNSEIGPTVEVAAAMARWPADPSSYDRR